MAGTSEYPEACITSFELHDILYGSIPSCSLKDEDCHRGKVKMPAPRELMKQH